MGDDRKAEYEMAPTSDPENPAEATEKAELETQEDGDDQQWSGLGKEELLRVADTPGWNWTRNILLILFWVAWVLMLIVAIVLVVKAPSCPNVEWYQKSSIYQVYMKSFKDGDNDGIGDLKGLTESVKKIKEFGAETILLSSLFEQADGAANFGQEIVDYMDIDSSLGTKEDFSKLIEEVQVNGMHIVLEFVPNHSSDKHPWFVESKKSVDNKYSDYYVWANGDNGGPPNDWTNYMGDPAWTKLDGDRDQYYYHFFEANQPDLNFNNGNVTESIQEAMDFWLKDMKVDGFVMSNIDRLLEGPITTTVVGRNRRETATDAMNDATVTPMEMITTMMEEDDEDDEETPKQDSKYTQYNNLLGDNGMLSVATKGLLDDLYSILEKNSYLGKYRVFIPQHNGPIAQNALYQNEDWLGFPSSLQFANMLGPSINSYTIKMQLDNLMEAKGKAGNSDLWNSWMLGHSEISRLASRTGTKSRALLMLLFTLPGTPMPFYGEELGLVDVAGENGQLGPYPWDDSANGGFSSNENITTFLPLAVDLGEVNAETQGKDEDSHLKYYQSLGEYHSKPSILAGDFNITAVNGQGLAFTRSFPEWPAYVVVINLDSSMMNKFHAMSTEKKATIVLSASGSRLGEEVMLDMLDVSSEDAYLIKLE